MDKLPYKSTETKTVEKQDSWEVKGIDYNRLNDKISELVDDAFTGGESRDDAQDLLITALQEADAAMQEDIGELFDAVETLFPGVKTYRGFVTQANSEIDTGELTPGVTYQIFDYKTNDDFTNLGAAANANGNTFTPGTLTGTVGNTQANRVAVKQKSTVTLTGASGAAQITGTGGLTKVFHFDTLLATTAAAFVSDYAADYLPAVAVTNLGDAIIFEAVVAGVPFTEPVIANVPYTLRGTNVNTQANVTAVKQKATITLTGLSGTAAIVGAGLEAKMATFGDDLADTAADFVTSHAASYLPDVAVTSSGDDLIFEAVVAGVPFDALTVLNLSGDLDGLVAPTTANREAIAQVDTLTLLGDIGSCNVTETGGLTKALIFDTSLTITAANFVTDMGADYLPDVIVTSSGDDLIFTAAAAGTGFTSPAAAVVAGDMAGGVVPTQANVTALAQIDTLSITGNSGISAVASTGGLTKLITWDTSATQTAANFVIAHSVAYAAQGIAITSNVANIFFTALAPGTSFTSPTINGEADPAHWDHSTVLIYGYEITALTRENSVGTITYARTAVGTYTFTCTGAFPSDGIFIPAYLKNYSAGIDDFTATLERTSDNILTLKTYDTGVLKDGMLTSFPIEFYVYPVVIP